MTGEIHYEFIESALSKNNNTKFTPTDWVEWNIRLFGKRFSSPFHNPLPVTIAVYAKQATETCEKLVKEKRICWAQDGLKLLYCPFVRQIFCSSSLPSPSVHSFRDGNTMLCAWASALCVHVTVDTHFSLSIHIVCALLLIVVNGIHIILLFGLRSDRLELLKCRHNSKSKRINSKNREKKKTKWASSETKTIFVVCWIHSE